MTTIHKHIVCHATQAWGHTRPLIQLAARFVKLRPVFVTVFTTNAFFERAKVELSRSFDSTEQEHATRIRSDEGDKYIEDAWKTLIDGGELFFAINPFDSIKPLSGGDVKVYCWSAGMTAVIFHFFGPESLGGKGNIRLKAEEQARLTGRSFDDIVKEIAFQPQGEVVRSPGIPPMYDYEYDPQDFALPLETGVKIFSRIHEILEMSDGLLLYTPETYEPEAVAAAKEWFGKTGRPVYSTGPLLQIASRTTATAAEIVQSGDLDAIRNFLDNTLAQSGDKSLIYISFGSVFWPTKSPEKLWAFLDVLMGLSLPFILSHASPFALIPDEIKDKVQVYGNGLLSSWTPQQHILDHPVTGWFVTHGGHNGILEAISAGVPQIMWPFSGDKPLEAVHLTDNLQVRTGHGLMPIYRTGYTPKGTVEAVKAEAREVLAKALSEDGSKKRERLQVVRSGVNGAWEDGGSSRRDVTAFLDSL
ncbi:UDP-Glycosyltransferase/glycogen phosphorylase [Daedaleopsis nitida]|nr:UDP-Glycosyltransferase/glycogen phosphorylase [Daedaleopsis nitida]